MQRFIWGLKSLLLVSLAILGASAIWGSAPALVSILSGATLLITSLALLLLQTVRSAQPPANSSITFAEPPQTLDLLDKEFDSHSAALFSALSDLAASDLAPAQRRQLLSLRRGLELLSSLQRDSMQYIRIAANEFSRSETMVFLEDVVWDIVTPILSKFRGREAEIVCHFGDDVPKSITCDEHLLRILLQHLIHNASAVTVRGEVSIALGLERLNPRTPTLTITVSDSGPGISQEQLTRAFDPFALPQGTNGRRMATSGLALALVRKAAQMLKGTLHLSSIEGKGTTITFRMPIRTAELVQEPMTEITTAGEQSGRAIIVDDSRGSLRLMKTILEQQGITVITFELAREALQFLRDTDREGGDIFDFAFLDNSIDDFDFAAITRYLSSRRSRFQRTVLMQSGSTLAARHGRSTEPGFDSSIAKPIRRSDLLCVLAGKPIPLRKSFAAQGSSETCSGENQTGNSLSTDRGAERNLVAPATSPAGTRQPICLVVDDNLVNMHTVSTLLRTKNIEILVAENGKEALDAFIQASHIDFILMDLQMPEMDGYEATQRIRQMERDKQHRTPIIALTAFSTHSEHEKCLANGMDGFLSKPVHAADLFELLQSYNIGKDGPSNAATAEHLTQAH